MPLDPLAPVATREFATLIDRLGPFEPEPEIAIACSGGPDSMALAVLAHEWAVSRSGQAVALIVDHGLRDGSAAEAALTRRRLNSTGIKAYILKWTGDKPARGIQEEARRARYSLLEEWCRRRGVLHLLLAHQRDDQAETVLQRLVRASGPKGLAAMAPMRETGNVRLLRPLLSVPRRRLMATLSVRKIDSVDDPSNRNFAFERVRQRAAMPVLRTLGLTPESLTGVAQRFALERQDIESETGLALARHASVFEEGYATLPSAFLSQTGKRTVLDVLDSLICAVGGRRYPTRRERLERLYRGLENGAVGRGRTLSGCMVRSDGETILIAREPGRILPVDIEEGAEVLWDGRFRVRLKAPMKGTKPRRFRLEPLKPGFLKETGDETVSALAGTLPALVRQSLPALYDRAGLVAVPHLGYPRETENGAQVMESIDFMPEKPVTQAVFSVV